MTLRLPLASLLCALSLGAGIAAADTPPEPGAAPPVAVDGGQILASGDIADVVIDEIERRLIRSFYQDRYDQWTGAHGKGKKKNKDLPPGLAKRGELPPGLAKQLVRNGQLPPGLQGRDLPPDLLDRLPRLHPDYRYVIADDKVMLVRRATNVILDILTVAAIDVLN